MKIETLDRQRNYLNKFTNNDSRQKELISILTDTTQSHNKILVSGEVGIGKTTLLANYIKFIKRQVYTPRLFYHFCDLGETPNSLNSMLSALIMEFQFFLGEEQKLPKKLSHLPVVFKDKLLSLPKNESFVVIIDALEYPQKVNKFDWIPYDLPDYITLILSFKHSAYNVTDPLVRYLNEEKFAVIPLEKLSNNGKEDVLKALDSGNELPEEIRKKILENPLFDNPLFLKTLIQALHFESSLSNVEDYLSQVSSKEFFRKFLIRLQEKYPWNIDALSLIYASRSGLKKNELIEILQSECGHVPDCKLIASYLDELDLHLLENDQIITFLHNEISNAASDLYILFDAGLLRHQYRLIEYFEKDKYSARSLYNLPWLYRETEEKLKLAEYLSDIKVFTSLCSLEFDNAELRYYLLDLPADYNFNERALYSLNSLSDIEDKAIAHLKLACCYVRIDKNFINKQYIEALKIYRFLVRENYDTYIYFIEYILEKTSKEECFTDEFNILYKNVCKEVIEITKELSLIQRSRYLLKQTSLFNLLALKCKYGDDYEKKYNNETDLKAYKKLTKENYSEYCFSEVKILNNNILCCSLDDKELIKDAYLEILTIIQNYPFKDYNEKLTSLVIAYQDVGCHYYLMDELKEAEEYLLRSIDLRSSLPDKYIDFNISTLGTSYHYIGVIYCKMKQYEKALPMLREAATLRRKNEEEAPDWITWLLADTLKQLGHVYKYTNRIEHAKTAFSESLEKYIRSHQADKMDHVDEIRELREELAKLDT